MAKPMTLNSWGVAVKQGRERKGTILSLFVLASTLLLSAVANAQTTNRPECTSAILNVMQFFRLASMSQAMQEAGWVSSRLMARERGL